MRYQSNNIFSSKYSKVYFHPIIGFNNSFLFNSPLIFCFSILEYNYMYKNLTNRLTPNLLNFYAFDKRFLFSFLKQSALYSSLIEYMLFINCLRKISHYKIPIQLSKKTHKQQYISAFLKSF